MVLVVDQSLPAGWRILSCLIIQKNVASPMSFFRIVLSQSKTAIGRCAGSNVALATPKSASSLFRRARFASFHPVIRVSSRRGAFVGPAAPAAPAVPSVPFAPVVPAVPAAPGLPVAPGEPS